MKVTVVYGPPMSGKTTYVNERMTDNDMVYDYDALIQAMTNSNYQAFNKNAHDMVMNTRKSMIEYSKQKMSGTMYIITTYMSGSIMKELEGINNVDYHMMTTAYEVCMQRVEQSDRPDKQDVIDVVKSWFNKHRKDLNLFQDDYSIKANRLKFYRTKAWRMKRKEILERDGYECVHCKASGQFTIYEQREDGKKLLEIDHIKELETHPHLKLDNNNLQTLCVDCHNKKHNRFQSKKNEWYMNDERW